MPDKLSDLIIRSATPDDMRDVAIMAGEFQAFVATLDGSDPYFDVEDAVVRYTRYGFGDKPLFSSLIAEVNGAPVCYAIYSIGFWADSLQGMVLLTDLFIRQDWRSSGVGQQMFQELKRIGEREDCELVMWTVWKKNQLAQRFYEKLGATSIDEERLMMLPVRP